MHKKVCHKKNNLNFKIKKPFRSSSSQKKIQKKINHLEKKKIDADSLEEFVKNNKLILKTQQRFKSERHNVFIEEINKIALGSNDDKRMQSIDLTETYTYGMNEDLV